MQMMLIDRAYTWYEPGLLHDWEHLMSLLKTKFLCIAKFSLAKLGRTRRHPRVDLNAYVMRFHERALDCCNLMAEEVIVDVCFHGMLEEYCIFLEMFSIFFQVDGIGSLHQWVIEQDLEVRFSSQTQSHAHDATGVEKCLYRWEG